MSNDKIRVFQLAASECKDEAQIASAFYKAIIRYESREGWSNQDVLDLLLMAKRHDRNTVHFAIRDTLSEYTPNYQPKPGNINRMLENMAMADPTHRAGFLAKTITYIKRSLFEAHVEGLVDQLIKKPEHFENGIDRYIYDQQSNDLLVEFSKRYVHTEHQKTFRQSIRAHIANLDAYYEANDYDAKRPMLDMNEAWFNNSLPMSLYHVEKTQKNHAPLSARRFDQ